MPGLLSAGIYPAGGTMPIIQRGNAAVNSYSSIRRRIARRGPITFAAYTDAALYGPGGWIPRLAPE